MKGTRVAIQMPNILSDNLRIRSDNIDATAIVVANVATGRYTGALKGRINNYRVDSIGIINLTTDAKLVPGPNGGFGGYQNVVRQVNWRGPWTYGAATEMRKDGIALAY